MREVLLSAANFPFTVALAVLVGLLALEILSWVFGFALSHALDNLLHIDLEHGIHFEHHAHVDHGVHVDHGHGGASHDGDVPVAAQVLNWMHVGSVPLLILFLFFLAGFGGAGVGIQELTGRAFSPWLTAIPATLVAVMVTKAFGGLSRKYLFREDTSAVSQDSLIGLPAIITLGATKKGTPSQAKVRDKFGQTHYVLVEALRDDDELATGETVLLVQREGHKYFVIENSVDTLLSLGPEELSTEVRQKA